jgi:hypothetical protein
MRVSGSTIRIGAQSAVRTEHSRRGLGRDDGVALWPVAMPGTFGDTRHGGMDLIAAVQMVRVGVEMAGDTPAVFGDGGRVVLGADACVQPFIDAGRDAARTGEEAVRDAGGG